MENEFTKANSLLFTLLIITMPQLWSQEVSRDTTFIPRVGQDGKDVIWVPSPNELVAKMLDVADVNENDFLIDLGSGDGRTVIAAARLGARALGIEYKPEMVQLSRKKAEDAGLSGRAAFIQADLFEYDLSEATVITMFLLPEINLKLRPELLDLKPGTRIVSNTFTMGSWEPDFEVTTDSNWNSWYTALMWIVPAKVEGRWKLDDSELDIHQEFQMFFGTCIKGKEMQRITGGRITGYKLSFSIGDVSYNGLADKTDSMSGRCSLNGKQVEWHATRIKD